MSLLVVGSMALDTIETPFGKAEYTLGGSATFLSTAASYFTNDIKLVGVVGYDFPQKEIEFLQSKGIDTTGVEILKDVKTFHWHGKYHYDMNTRDSITTELNALGREFTAHLVGTDPNTDVAVIKIDAKDLPVASVGNSDDVQVGQWVLAIGNPLQLNSTVTAGIVSALGRNINIDGNSYAINNFIQTHAAINPGNSDGPLVDINGSVIGINSAIKSQSGYYQGYGFAIPINLAKNVATELIKSGKISRGYIGVSIKDVDQKEAKGLGLDKAKGVLVQDVIKGGAGEDAGLKIGDVILTVDGKEVNAANELQSIIGQKHPGESAALKIFRDGKSMDMSVTLKARDENQNAASNTAPKKEEESNKSENSSRSFDKTGFSVTELTGAQKQKFDVNGGAYVTSVKKFSESFDRGLREGLVIIEADKNKVDDINDLDAIISKKSKGDILVLKVKSPEGQVRLVAIEIQ
ncbi:unnamed protein product [Rotaria sp. Silwood1]|nr:unnamed protein product [Rotaria sp. Silwood1]